MQEAGQEALRRGGKGEDERVSWEARVMRRRLCRTTALLLGTAFASLGWVTAPAFATVTSAGPAQWAIDSVSGPARFKPASSGDLYVVTATNVGGQATEGPVTITDALHGEAEATEVVDSFTATEGNYGEAFTNSPLSCTLSSPSSITCGYAGRVDPGDTLTFAIKVHVTAVAGHVENTATVSGGEAASASTTRPTPVSSEPVPFGVASFLTAASTAQAGAHPNFTTSFTPNWSEIVNGLPLPAAAPREIGVDLPPGLTGDALAVPRCDMGSVRREECDEDAAAGVATVRVKGNTRKTLLLYNITPYPGEPAAFAFSVGKIAVARLDTRVIVSSDGEYAIHVSIPDISEKEPILFSSVTLWGVPALHNGPGPDTSNTCHFSAGTTTCDTFGGPGAQAAQARPFLRNPTSCGGSPPVGFAIDSWLEPPGVFPSGGQSSSPFPTQTECGLLAPLFTPTLAVTPDTAQAGAPAGYAVNLEVPQSQSSQTLATPDLKDATVTLPAGTVASPSSANGLQACSDAQFGIDESGTAISNGPASCPQGSQIGTVAIQTPLLPKPLEGQVFLGQPECSPCGPGDAAEGRMVRLFLQASYEDGSYVRIKLAGRTQVDQRTGQLTTVFKDNPQQPFGKDNPQQPFEKLTLRLDGGPGAPLANPAVCGTATTTSRLTPWSSTKSAPFSAEPSSGFQVENCPAPRFAPSFSAGMTGSVQAGAYSPFSVTLGRADQDQALGGIAVSTPPGLLGAVAHVALCGEARANAGTCGPESKIGDVAVAAGPGPDPYWITGGRAYLTGSYAGAPFGLSVVVPAVAGPFDLGQEVVRARVQIDPLTAALTVVSDPLPTQKDGIPFQVKTVDVDVNRSEFIFNATNCDPRQNVGASISSVQGANANVSWPYQPVNCANLPFKPSFTVSTQGSTSKANGASLDVKVAERPGEANIHKVGVQLPLALPSRLTTIQKACGEAQFAADPAGCPPASVVGVATAHSPVLQAPLNGPAYLVSHGGAAFPDLVILLQGNERGGDVHIELVGHTDIKKGITYSKFETLPDAPVSGFELSLPEGPHSALTANANLCAPTRMVLVRKRVAVRRNGRLKHVLRSVRKQVSQPLEMPTTITGQNGAVVKQATKIGVTGCPKATAKPKKVGKARTGSRGRMRT
jgi:hypothetical protein